MSYIFYYSNLCDHSKKLLQRLSRMDAANAQSIHYICIDKRTTRDGKTFVELDNGEQMVLPKVIKEVPAFMFVTDGFKVVYGNDIYDVISSMQTQMVTQATGGNMAPASYQPGGNNKTEQYNGVLPSTNHVSFLDASDTQSSQSWTDSYGSIISHK